MYGFLISAIGIAAGAAIAKRRAIDDYLESLPEEERLSVLAQMAEDAKEYRRHKEAIEIAEAGRPRNFWGQ